MKLDRITMNKLHNIRNPNQGGAKRVLCVCSAGLLRSPTAAVVLHREFGFNTRSCGLNEQYALIDCNQVLLNWADEVVVMEPWMAHELEEWEDKLVCLDIPDMFPYMDKELQNLIIQNYNDKVLQSSS